MWRTGTKETIEYEKIIDFLTLASQQTHEFVLGTDSQPFFSGTLLVSVIAVISKDNEYHCRYFYKTHSERPIHHNLYERIFSETQTTIDLASALKEVIPQANITIHLDVSPEESKHATGRFCRSLVSMVRGYGYENVEVKPNAWCASKIADKYTKRAPPQIYTES